VTGLHTPDVEHHVHHETHGFESTGRGGAGNMVGGSRSPSRETAERRTPSRLTSFMNKVVPHHHHHQQQQHEQQQQQQQQQHGQYDRVVVTPTIQE
jgi:hypothetical protein